VNVRRALSSFFRDLSGETRQAGRRRQVVALALAVAIVEITAMSIPSHTYTLTAPAIEQFTIAKLIHIQHRAKPTPKPKPTPLPVVHAKLIAETHVQPHVVNPGAPSQRQRIKRVASAAPLVRTRYHSKRVVEHVPMGGHGAGTSKLAKAETGGIGPGGTGTGESGSGQGTGGAPPAQEPCGYVDFVPNGKPTDDPNTGRVWEYVAIVVHFPDGSAQSLDLDYPFYYPSEAQDPFIHDNLPATFQFPPPSQAANEPPLVQYVMKHTSADGYTLLRDCPK
jgi:hypothetical protein